MATYEYFGSAQFNQILEQRDHDDTFVSEVIQMGNIFNKDIGEFISDDLMMGNTATIRKHYRRQEGTRQKPIIFNGTTETTMHGTITDHTYFGMSPIKDDYSTFLGAAGYHGLPETDPQRIDTETVLDALKMDAMEMAENILEPEPIGAVGSAEFRKYQKMWDDSPSLQATYPTVAAYQQQLVKDHQAQQTGLNDLSDAFIGLFATGSTIQEYNAVAIYHTVAHIFPQITVNPTTNHALKEFPSQRYLMQYNSGEFVAVCGWEGFTHVIRQGVVKNKFDGATVKKYRAKATHRMVYGTAASPTLAGPDPIIRTVYDTLPSSPAVGLGAAATGMLEIQVQLPDEGGVPVYGEIRIWDYGTMHAFTGNTGHISTILGTMSRGGSNAIGDTNIVNSGGSDFTVDDGATAIGTIGVSASANNYTYIMGTDGDAALFSVDSNGVITANAPLDYSVGKVYYFTVEVMDLEGFSDYAHVKVSVNNINNKPEPPVKDSPDESADAGSDLIFFPLEYEASREIPIFKRERFLRESTQLAIYSQQKKKVEWYESGWFQVVLFAVAVIISIWVPGTGIVLTGLFETVVTAAVTIAITGAVASAVLNMIDNPLLAAVLAVAIMAYTGKLDMGNLQFSQIASLAMEGTNTYVEKYWAEKMQELKQKMEDFEEQMKAIDADMDALIELAGGVMRSDSADWITYSSSVGNIESTDDMINRTLNVKNAIINRIDSTIDIKYNLKLEGK